MTSRTVTRLPFSESLGIATVVQNALVAALIARPQEVHIVSAWITDVEVIDNRGGAFSNVLPGLPEQKVRLSEALVAMAHAGTAVRITVWPSEDNDVFLKRVSEAEVGGRLQLHRQNHQHQKILVASDLLVLSGSMNFTWSGINRNGESLTLTINDDDITRSLADVRRIWETRA